MTEAVLLIEVASQLATARRRPASSREDNPFDPAWLATDAAIAEQRAWLWSTLAELEGFDGMDGAIIGSMAEQWSLDFRSLLEAVRAATT